MRSARAVSSGWPNQAVPATVLEQLAVLGSGDDAEGSNDTTVTTLDHAAAGDTVTIKGTVRTNRDFGAC